MLQPSLRSYPPFDFCGGECYTLPIRAVDAERKCQHTGSESGRSALNGNSSRIWGVMRVDVDNVMHEGVNHGVVP